MYGTLCNSAVGGVGRVGQRVRREGWYRLQWVPVDGPLLFVLVHESGVARLCRGARSGVLEGGRGVPSSRVDAHHGRIQHPGVELVHARVVRLCWSPRYPGSFSDLLLLRSVKVLLSVLESRDLLGRQFVDRLYAGPVRFPVPREGFESFCEGGPRVILPVPPPSDLRVVVVPFFLLEDLDDSVFASTDPLIGTPSGTGANRTSGPRVLPVGGPGRTF